MALKKFEMGKKWFLFFMTITICFIVVMGGFIVIIATDSPYDTELEMLLYSNQLAVYNVNSDYGEPTFNNDTYFYGLALVGGYVGQKLQFTLRMEHCILIGVFSYIRDPIMDGIYIFSDGSPDSVVRYGDSNIFTTTIPNDITQGNPWVVMAAVYPMGYSNDVPMSSVYVTIKLS